MGKNLTAVFCKQILESEGYFGYDIIDIYETSFRGIRKNDYILSEINVDLIKTDAGLSIEQVVHDCSFVVHVLKRYR